MRQRRRTGALVTTVAALLVAACQFVVGLKDEEGAPRTPEVAPSDAAVDSKGDSQTACVGKVPPPPPSLPPDRTGTQGEPLFFAVRGVSSVVDGGTVGYNLDRHCTSAGDDVPCLGSPDDGERGIDNAFFANFIATLAIPLGGSDPALATTNESIATGSDGLFLALYGYNGHDDDDKVSFALVGSPGLVSTACGDAGADGGPRWDGCDVWSVGQAEMVATVLRNAQPAYVAGRTLVARYGGEDLVVPFGGTELRLRDALVTARLVQQAGGRYELRDGVVTGRGSSATLFETAARVTVKINGNIRHLCETPTTIEIIRDRLCPALDLRVGGDNPSAACNGMSLAIGFHAAPVAVGVMGPEKPLFECPPFDAGCP